MKKVTIEFDSDDSAKDFMSWMDNSGEQEYLDSQEYYTRIEYDYDTMVIRFSHEQ